MTFGSLFAGIGGFDLGLERAGIVCRWQVEIDDYCRRVLAKYWPGVKRYGDIRELTGAELEPVDLICGGFPCQDLSQAGKRVGIEGARSGLWFEFARLVGELRPRFVLIENVPGLLVPGAMSRVVGGLAGLGYVGCWLCLRASDFGASHLRKRVFIVAHRIGERGERWGNHRTLGGAEVAQFGKRDQRKSSEWRQSSNENDTRRRAQETGRPDGALADPGNGQLQEPGRGSEGRTGVGSAGAGALADCDRRRCEIKRGGRIFDRERTPRGHDPNGCGLPFAPGPSDPRWPAILSERPDLAPALESPLRGVADGIPDWLDRAMRDRTKRLRRLGNAVVPDCAEWIGRQIVDNA